MSLIPKYQSAKTMIFNVDQILSHVELYFVIRCDVRLDVVKRQAKISNIFIPCYGVSNKKNWAILLAEKLYNQNLDFVHVMSAKFTHYEQYTLDRAEIIFTPGRHNVRN